MAYNPYNAIKNIYDSKVAYHTNQSLGKDPAQFHAQALPSYQELVKNGYESLASQLEGMDAVQAGELLKNYKPDEQFNVDDAFNTMTGGTSTVQNLPGNGQTAIPQNLSAENIINAPHPNDASINKLMGMGTGETGMAQDVFSTANGLATGAIQTQPSAVTQGLYGAYNDQNNRLNGAIQYDANGNVISGLNTEHYNIGRNQLNYLNNFDVTKQPYYQGIMDAYNLGGYNAAQGAYANGAADNGGNIDSYAAANANRQQLAFTTAGMQQAMAMANQNQQNWQNLYSQMSNDLYNQGQLSLQTLEQARLQYQTDADERMAALDTAGSLAKEQMAQSIAALQTMVDERVKDKGISEEQAIKEADIAEAWREVEAGIARDLEQSRIEADWRKHESDNTLTGTLDANEKDYNARIHESDNQLAGTYDTNYTSRSNNAANNYTDQLKAQLSYQSDQDRYRNALDQIYAQAEVDQAKAEYDKMSALELQQALIDQGLLPSGVTLMNPGTGTTPVVTQTVAETYDNKPDQFISDIYLAVMGYGNNGNTDYNMLSNFGIKKGMSVDDLRATLTGGENGWGWSNTSKIISELQKQMEEDPNFAVKFNALFSDDIEKYIPRGTKTNGRANSIAE